MRGTLFDDIHGTQSKKIKTSRAFSVFPRPGGWTALIIGMETVNPGREIITDIHVVYYFDRKVYTIVLFSSGKCRKTFLIDL